MDARKRTRGGIYRISLSIGFDSLIMVGLPKLRSNPTVISLALSPVFTPGRPNCSSVKPISMSSLSMLGIRLPNFNSCNTYIFFAPFCGDEIFQSCNGGDFLLNVISFEILKFSWRPSRAYSSSKSSETVFCVLRFFFILDTGHHLSSHPTYMSRNTNQLRMIS